MLGPGVNYPLYHPGSFAVESYGETAIVRREMKRKRRREREGEGVRIQNEEEREDGGKKRGRGE